MAYPVKLDHVATNKALLPSRWKDKPNVLALVETYSREFQILEDTLFQLLEERGIYEALGLQLDVLGALFGVDRLGRGDEDYRSAILLKISQLNDDGTTEVFMQVLRNIGNTNLVDFWEHASGDVHAYMGEGFTNKTYGQVENAVPAGVNVRVMVDEGGDSFIPAELTPSTGDLQVYDGTDIHDLQVGTNLDLEVQTFNPDSSMRAYLPELEDVEPLNPLAEIINRDSFSYTGNIVMENGDFMVDEKGNPLVWEDYQFI